MTIELIFGIYANYLHKFYRYLFWSHANNFRFRSEPPKPAPATCLPAPPDDPQGIRVASVIEFSVCLCVCLSVLGKFSNFFLHYKATVVRAVIGPLTPMIHGD